MKKFIQSLLKFLLALIVASTFIIEFTEYLLEYNSNFSINSKPTYVVLGHSHPESAFNDSLIENLSNQAQASEPYFFTYFKLKKILEQNPSIEVIFLEYTNNQVDKSMDNWIWGYKYMNLRYPKYAPFLGHNDKLLLAKNNIRAFKNASSLGLKYNISKIVTGKFTHLKELGGYKHLIKNKTDSILKVKANEILLYENDSTSEANLCYLSKIIDLCKEQKKEIIFVRCPQHPKYHGYSNEITYQKIRKERYASIEYLDFSKFKLSNTEFGDMEHLNYKGAKVFSIWFNQLLKNGLLQRSNKQQIIDEEISSLQ